MSGGRLPGPRAHGPTGNRRRFRGEIAAARKANRLMRRSVWRSNGAPTSGLIAPTSRRATAAFEKWDANSKPVWQDCVVAESRRPAGRNRSVETQLCLRWRLFARSRVTNCGWCSCDLQPAGESGRWAVLIWIEQAEKTGFLSVRENVVIAIAVLISNALYTVYFWQESTEHELPFAPRCTRCAQLDWPGATDIAGNRSAAASPHPWHEATLLRTEVQCSGIIALAPSTPCGICLCLFQPIPEVDAIPHYGIRPGVVAAETTISGILCESSPLAGGYLGLSSLDMELVLADISRMSVSRMSACREEGWK